MNGKAVGDRYRASCLKIEAIFISGYTVDIVRNKGCGGDGALFLLRQTIPDQLLTSVREDPGA